MAELLPRNGPFRAGREKVPPGCSRPSSAQVLHYLVLIVFSPMTVTSLTASVHHRARTAADLPPRLAMPAFKPNPSPPKEQSKQTWSHEEWSWSPQTDSQFCQGGSAKDGFPGKIKPNHRLEVVSACKHLHATSAALN